MEKVIKLSRCKIHLLETWGLALSLLWARLWLAQDFWSSALTKINIEWLWGIIPYYNLNDSTYMLFEYEYEVPLLAPNVAAWMGTTVELIAPLFLLIGLATRITGFALAAMVGVITISYGMYPEHYVWWLITVILMSAGGGIFSADHWIRKRVLKE